MKKKLKEKKLSEAHSKKQENKEADFKKKGKQYTREINIEWKARDVKQRLKQTLKSRKSGRQK